MEQIETLEWWQKFGEYLSEIGFIGVIVGVIGESAEIFVKWGKNERFRRWFRVIIFGWVVNLGKLVHRYLLGVESVFFIMLVVGLAMEFLGGHKAGEYGDRISSILKKEVADTRLQAAKSEKETADARLELTKLKLSLLSRAERAEWFVIIRELARVPKVTIMAEYDVLTPDAKDLALAFEHHLKSIGFEFKKLDEPILMVPFQPGIMIFKPTNERLLTVANEIIKALIKGGVNAGLGPEKEGTVLHIRFGPK